MSLKRRYSLKTKEAKQVLSEASQRFKLDLDTLFGDKVNVEIVESEHVQIYIVNSKPIMFKTEDFLPFLGFTEFIHTAPKITVDMGAIPFVCKGANVMAPGIRRIEGEFSKGDLVVIIDEKHGKSLALGESLFDAAIFRETKNGPVIKTLHYVSDKYWNIAKLLPEKSFV
jgi:PUA domain protein